MDIFLKAVEIVLKLRESEGTRRIDRFRFLKMNDALLIITYSIFFSAL
jgi:hypothetical protein